MSENSPRWPGSNGSPGLDFSPYRTGGKDREATQVTEASTRSESKQSAGTGITPTVSERAANTAKEWAAVPVTGLPTQEPEPTEEMPGTPVPRPGPAPPPRSRRSLRSLRLPNPVRRVAPGRRACGSPASIPGR
ncbi:hypothetical protein [Tessaracoccus coleopterorum]|uniref:hypothetical protein n=1 Tax=Tessaracoccus coleopterorum TaxID=2714950 RepID=UPI001E558519|nr:hypothetical protein [Tessaracoccus coleopterorum]